MIQVIPVRRTYLSIACDWPGCEERIDFPEGPDDEVRNITLLNASHALARRLGWEVTDDMDGEVVCPNHPRGGGVTVLLITIILITHTHRKEHQ